LPDKRQTVTFYLFVIINNQYCTHIDIFSCRRQLASFEQTDYVKMRFVALVSGGKDSIYSILEAVRNGHEFVACLHIGAPESSEEESYMYQTAASEVVRTLVEDCLEVPLLLHQLVGTSRNTSLVYDNSSDEGDEVEDLFVAIRKAKEEFQVQAVCSGAILSTYQRVRIEHVCSRLGMTSLSYLWRLLPQKELLPKMLEDGIEAVVVRAACPPGLIPRKHLNKTLGFLWHSGLFERLHQRYQFHVCGEGGEYESLVIDSPLHKKKLVFDEVEIDETDDGVGELRIPKCHAEEKGENDIKVMVIAELEKKDAPISVQKEASKTTASTEFPSLVCLPRVKEGNGGLLHVSELCSSKPILHPDLTEAEIAVREAQEIFSVLRMTLESFDAKATDVLFVHLYLSEISHFANINQHYQEFFGTLLPPSRSCVAVGRGVLPGGRRVLLDCMVQLGSGEYMRSTAPSNQYAVAAHATKTSKLRDVLHVQSISHWAPVCVGPYSQVNTLRSCLHFFAGQIGLVPATMELQPTWILQLEQCWKNVASVFDALEAGSLDHLFSSLIYVSHTVYMEEGALAKIQSISSKQMRENGSIVPGQIEPSGKSADAYDGYEDEGTWQEMRGEHKVVTPCPSLVVSIPEMPKGAIIEVEVIGVTAGAASCLEIRDASTIQKCVNKANSPPPLGWNTGHTFPSTQHTSNDQVQLYSFVRTIGHRCAANVLVTATAEKSSNNLAIGTGALLRDMFASADKVLAEGRSGLNAADAIHVRLYYIAANVTEEGDAVALDDGLQLRSSLESAIATWGSNKTSLPSSSVVPVSGLNLINSTIDMQDVVMLFAMHVLVIDPVHFETEKWINKDREYNT
jgi:diphthine-ammonia ligase